MEISRLAIATPAGGPDPSIAAMAMVAGLTERHLRVQHFRSVACPTTTESVGQISGLPGRHLDAWLMPCEVQRRLFTRGARHVDLSLVEGTLGARGGIPNTWESVSDQPGVLRPIAESLDLPVVAVIPCSHWQVDSGHPHLPRIPEGADAVLLDGVEDWSALEPLRRLIRLGYGIPVLGGVDALPQIRSEYQRSFREGTLPDESIRALSRSFLRYADVAAIRELARSRPFPEAVPVTNSCGLCSPRIRVAYAQDEAFGRYFPDTLEALEALGAHLVEFSPLRDEALPENTDVVMIGCGFPDLFVDELAANVSMFGSLQQHVCRGRRIYSEGGGTAYLGRSMILPDRSVAGVGILPFDAELLPGPRPPAPVTHTLTHDSWLGPQGTVVRGYRSTRWRLHTGVEPLDCPSCYGSLTPDHDLTFHHHAVGSLIHLHLGALPEVVAAFAGPHRPSLRRPSA